jgi:glycosyltransferase involved in cell wall biosynthesis
VGGAGWQVDADDPSTMADHVLALFRQPGTLADLRHRGRQRASVFTWRRSAGMLLALVDQLLLINQG